MATRFRLAHVQVGACRQADGIGSNGEAAGGCQLQAAAPEAEGGRGGDIALELGRAADGIRALKIEGADTGVEGELLHLCAIEAGEQGIAVQRQSVALVGLAVGHQDAGHRRGPAVAQAEGSAGADRQTGGAAGVAGGFCSNAAGDCGGAAAAGPDADPIALEAVERNRRREAVIGGGAGADTGGDGLGAVNRLVEHARLQLRGGDHTGDILLVEERLGLDDRRHRRCGLVGATGAGIADIKWNRCPIVEIIAEQLI